MDSQENTPQTGIPAADVYVETGTPTAPTDTVDPQAVTDWIAQNAATDQGTPVVAVAPEAPVEAPVETPAAPVETPSAPDVQPDSNPIQSDDTTAPAVPDSQTPSDEASSADEQAAQDGSAADNNEPVPSTDPVVEPAPVVTEPVVDTPVETAPVDDTPVVVVDPVPQEPSIPDSPAPAADPVAQPDAPAATDTPADVATTPAPVDTPVPAEQPSTPDVPVTDPAPAPVVDTPAPQPDPVVDAPAEQPPVEAPAPAVDPVVDTPVETPAAPIETPAPAPAPVEAPAPAPHPASSGTTINVSQIPNIIHIPQPIVISNNSLSGIPEVDQIVLDVPPANAAIFARLLDYTKQMAPRRPIDATVGARLQKSLYLTIINLVNREEDHFQALFTGLLKFIDKHSGDGASVPGAFDDHHLFRFLDNIELDVDQQKGFRFFLTALRNLANPQTRANVLKSTDIQKVFRYGPTDRGRAKLMNYFNL